MNDHVLRRAFGSPFALEDGWATRLAMSIGFGAFLMLMGVISFPLPWTPVPFSMMPMALLVAGAYQRPKWGALSVGLYLAAGALGAPVYAERTSGVEHLVGSTAGYLFGYILVAPIIGAYMRRPRKVLAPRQVKVLAGLVGIAVVMGVAAIAWMMGQNAGLATLRTDLVAWGLARSVLWILVFVIAASMALALWTLRMRRGAPARALNLFLVMMGAIVVLHICGVTTLWLVGGMHIWTAVVLGSIVFLPFDILKAGLAAALAMPFYPEAPDA